MFEFNQSQNKSFNLFSLFKLFGVWWLISGLFGLGIFGAIVYVALHFLAKVW